MWWKKVTVDVWIKMLQRCHTAVEWAWSIHTAQKKNWSECCSFIYSCASMLPWTGAVFFTKLSCTAADVLWFRSRSIAPLCLRKNLVLGSIFWLVGFCGVFICLLVLGFLLVFSGEANFLNRCSGKKSMLVRVALSKYKYVKGSYNFF